MKVFARAPMRIDWAGGWTDVPHYANEHGGAVVNSAIGLYAWVECLVGGGRIRLHADDADLHRSFTSSKEIRYDGELDLHKAALNMFPVLGGIEVISRSDAPIGAGLGGSGALDVALIAALASCRQEAFDPAELAELGFQLEAGELGLAGGRQDQYAAALGGTHLLEFTEGEVNARRLAFTEDQSGDLGRHVALIYTGRSHFSSQTHDRVWERFASGDAAVTDALGMLRELPARAAEAFERADWKALAGVIDENWRQQQLLDATIATPKTRELEASAREAGAWGLKATGAGAGGCLVVLAPPDRRDQVIAAVTALGAAALQADFDEAGVTVRREADDDDAR